MFDDLDLDIEVGFARDEADMKKQTSEKYKENVRVFLRDLDIRIDSIKSPTFWIINNVLEDFTLPLPGQQLRIRTQQQINLISFILKIIETHGTINELVIATYTLNREAFSILFDLLQGGKIQKLSLFLASSYSFRDKEYYAYLKSTAASLKDKYDFHLVFAWLHFKITLVRCGESYYQFEGSMNYSMNNMAEQIVFENRRETYEYDHNFIHRTMTDRTNKALEIIC